MTPAKLSRLEAWHLENLLYEIFAFIIKSTVDLPSFEFEGCPFDCITSLIDKDVQLAKYIENPSHHKYGYDCNIRVSTDNLYRLWNFIIENNDLDLAIDLISNEINFKSLIILLEEISHKLKSNLKSIPYLQALEEFRTELFRWCVINCNRRGSSIEKEIKRRPQKAFELADKSFGYILRICETSSVKPSESKPESQDHSFSLADYFIPDFDQSKLHKIQAHILQLSKSQEASYISKIISIIAYAHYTNRLKTSYAHTIKAVLKHLNITLKNNYLHPATFGKPTVKGRLREAYQEAIKFYETL